MTFETLPTKEFVKDFSKITAADRERVRRKMREVAQDPTRYKRLHYALSDSCRVRIGKLRILFSYDLRRKELYLEKIVFDHAYGR